MNLKSEKHKQPVENTPQIIDVVESFDFSGQSNEYVTAYKKWRKNKDNPFAYNFTQNAKESTFIDGKGFMRTLPQDIEASILKSILYVLGNVFTIYLFIEFVLSKILVEFLDLIGLNIHNSFSNFSIYGGKREVIIVITTITILKFVVPLIILYKKFKIPVKAFAPCKLQSGKDLVLCIFLGIAVSVITSISRAYSSSAREFFSFFKGYNNELSLMGQKELIIYMFFDIVIVSILTEFLFSGIIFQVLRQFGDCYAVIISALLSSLITHDLSCMPATFAISAVSMISILRSGTLFTAFSIRIIHKIYLFSLTIIETSDSDMIFKRSTFMFVCLIVSVIVMIVIWHTTPKKHSLTSNYKTFLSMKQKFKLLFSGISTTALVLLCVFVIILDIVI